MQLFKEKLDFKFIGNKTSFIIYRKYYFLCILYKKKEEAFCFIDENKKEWIVEKFYEDNYLTDNYGLKENNSPQTVFDMYNYFNGPLNKTA